MTRGPVQLGQSIYNVEIDENAEPGPLLQLTATVLNSG